MIIVLLVLDQILLVYTNVCIRYVFYLFYCEMDFAHEGLSVG